MFYTLEVLQRTMITDNLVLWIGFTVGVLVLLALDLGVFHRKSHVVSIREALTWSAVWIGLALLFNVGVFYWMGSNKGIEFLTGYLIEKSLSVDNIFVFVLLFSYFKVPALYQHKVLFWGVIGAFAMRAVLIIAGAALLREYSWVLYIFGGFLVITAVKMALQKEESMDPGRNPVVRLARRFMSVSDEYDGDKFFTVRNGKRLATPLFLVLLAVEFTDLVFAVDSIPAIFAVTNDPFIVYTSNIFAILGLRSLYFALAGIMDKFHYLKQGLALILAFVGVKMLISQSYHIPPFISLAVIVSILTASVVLSLLRPRAKATNEQADTAS